MEGGMSGKSRQEAVAVMSKIVERSRCSNVLKNMSKQRPLRVYVAGPYSGDDHQKVVQNTIRATCEGCCVMEHGHLAYVPHCATFPIDNALIENGISIDYETWISHCFSIIARWADVVYKFASSPGADREEEYAKSLGIPVIYSIDELPGRTKLPVQADSAG